MQVTKLLIVLFQIGICVGLRLPKIFKNGMVLQAGGKDRSVNTIWGFMDGVRSNVTLMGRCKLSNGDSFQVKDVFFPNKPVSIEQLLKIRDLGLT